MKQVKEMERLDKILANNGFGTRKEVKHFIRSKTVTVDGIVICDTDAKVNINSSVIAVNGVEIEVKSQVYFMMNKKAGYVCSTRSGFNPTVFDLLKEKDNGKYLGGNLNIVGRLDLDTEGLLILTSDGDLNHRLTSPKWNIPKKYLVYLRDSVNENQRKVYAEEIEKGIHIGPDGKEGEADCKPGKLEWYDKNAYRNAEGKTPADVCALTVYEGMFHEVKRIFAALGNEVIYLKRLSVNNLELDESLEPGEYRELSQEELKLLDTGAAD
ncbi:MAG: rRNA pseudouridine synthase [Spirochaetia bacterium]|nr:rRNA pseudouridine synthase [Spirochaetia bacterium]